MKIRVLLVAIVVIALLIVLGVRTGMSGWSYPSQQFNVTPDRIYLNWTNDYNSSFTVMVNDSFGGWLNVTVDNTTADGSNSLHFNYTSSSYYCFSGVCANIFIYNESGNHSIISKNMTATNSTVFYLNTNITSLASKPGRYYGNVMVYNTSSSTENTNITVTLDVPVYIDSSTGAGSFSGALTSNANTYQSFYVNTTSIQNATNIKVNLSWSPTQNFDLYLFDNSSTPKLLAKSINRSSTSESIDYSFIPESGGIWEIRVYGNSTSGGYFGNVYLTALDSSARSLNYSLRNVSYSNQSIITLINNGGLNVSSVSESKELSYVIRFSSNGTRNFTFLVPDSSIAQKIKISLNWTAKTSAYLFNLYKPDNSFAATSINKYIYANVSDAEMEEYNETSDITKGFWRLEIKNGTNSTSIDPYSVTIYIKVNEANWLTTNYTTSSLGFSFSTLAQPNSTYVVNVSFVVPNNTMNGLYEGWIKYLDINGAGIKIPVRVNVTTPVLVMNNTWNSSTVRFDENTNSTFSKTLSIIVNNTGFYDIDNIKTANSTSLSYGSRYLNFSYQAPTSIANGGFGILNLTVEFNTSTTVETQGTYTGWIFLNVNDSTYPSYPYQGFVLSLEVNLTNTLDVRVTGINTYDTILNWITNSSTLPRNVTIQYLNIYYANGTQLKGTTIVNYTNISSARLYNKRANYWSAYLNKSETSDFTGFEPSPNSGNYQFNATIPNGLPGGEYDVHVVLTNYNGALAGESNSNKTLSINGTGLYMSTEKSSSVYLNNQTNYTYTVNISNFGFLAASSATINLTESCSGWSIEDGGATCSGATYDSTYKKFTISPAANTTTCQVWWKIVAGSSESSGCPGYIRGSETATNRWFNPSGINLSVAVSMYPTPTNATDGTQTTTTTSNTTSTGQALKYMNITSYTSLIQIAQGNSSTVTVTVKNTNTTRSQDIKLVVENLTSSWFNVTPTLISVAALNSTTFTVRFNIPSTAEIKTYNALFKAISNYVNVSKSFVLKVLPSESTKNEIIQTLASYRNNMTQLSLEINNTKDQGKNVSLAEDKLLELRTIIDQAETYTDQNNYFDANQLLSSIQQLIDATKDEITKAQTGATTNGSETGAPTIFGLQTWMILVIVGVVVSVAAFLAFMFWPKGKAIFSKKGMPTIKIKEFFGKPKDIVKPQEENPWVKLKEKWANIKKEKKTGTQ